MPGQSMPILVFCLYLISAGNSCAVDSVPFLPESAPISLESSPLRFSEAGTRSQTESNRGDKAVRAAILMGSPIIGGFIGYLALKDEPSSQPGMGAFLGMLGGGLAGLFIGVQLAF